MSFLNKAAMVGVLIATAAAAHATLVTANFGGGAGDNIQSAYPTGAAGNNLNSVVAITSPLLLHLGELNITAIGGALECVEANTAGNCANNLAYGLGVFGGAQNGRIDAGESIVLTLTDPNYTVKLISFVITGFNSTEQGRYTIGGNSTSFNPSGTDTTLVTVNGTTGIGFTNTVTWSVVPQNTGNFSLSQITLDITSNAVPEPATLGLVGLGLMGLGALKLKKRSV